MKAGWVVTMMVAASACAQTVGSQGSGAAPAAADKVYSNAELHMTFWYPSTLQPRDAESVAELGHRMVFGNDPEFDSTQAQGCSKVLLAVAEPVGNSKQEPSASLTLYDIAPNCVPPAAEKKKKEMDQALRALAREGTTVLGMMPIEEPIGYSIQGSRAFLAAAQGQPVTKTDLQTGESELTATVAVAVRGHILSWVAEANSLEGFNRLLASRLDFGTGKPQSLTPMQFH